MKHFNALQAAILSKLGLHDSLTDSELLNLLCMKLRRPATPSQIARLREKIQLHAELLALRGMLHATSPPSGGMRYTAAPNVRAWRRARASSNPLSKTWHGLRRGAAVVPAMALVVSMGCSHMYLPDDETTLAASGQYAPLGANGYASYHVCIGDECKQPFFQKMAIAAPTIPKATLRQQLGFSQETRLARADNIDSPAEFAENWARRWSERDAEGYFALYADEFKPSHGGTAVTWKAERQRRMKRAQQIAVKLSDVEVEERGNRAIVRFWQTYESSAFRSRVRKALELVQEDGNWKIKREQVLTATA